MTIPRHVRQFTELLTGLGAPVALAYLNAGVPHRYSAIYRLRDQQFENVYLHDKQGEVRPDDLAVVPFELSFCQFVLRDGSLCADNTRLDPRLNGHPAQGVVISYHGVPIPDSTGALVGTLCHFDSVLCPLPEAEFVLMQRAAGALLGYVARVRSPAGDRSA